MAGLKRILGSEGLKSKIAYNQGSGTIYNDFDSKEPWSKIREEKDEFGNTWVVIPKFYTKYDVDEKGNITGRCISIFNGGSGWHLNPIFRNESGKEIDKIYISKYLLGDLNGELISQPGYYPSSTQDIATARTLINRYENNDLKYSYQLFDI
jgi:hypothetical protein